MINEEIPPNRRILARIAQGQAAECHKDTQLDIFLGYPGAQGWLIYTQERRAYWSLRARQHMGIES